MEFEDAISNLRDYLELPKWEPSAAGAYVLWLDDTLEVVLTQSQDKLCCTAWVVDLPADETKQAALIQKLLEVNFARADVDAEYVSIRPDKPTVELHRNLSLVGLEASSLGPFIDNFVNGLEFWQKIAQDDADSSALPFFPFHSSP